MSKSHRKSKFGIPGIGPDKGSETRAIGQARSKKTKAAKRAERNKAKQSRRTAQPRVAVAQAVG